MKISYNWLQSFFKKKLPVPEKLADLLTMHSFETELNGKVNSDYLLNVDVLPNRAHDCLSYWGIAREIAVILKYPFELTDYSKKIKENSKEKASEFVKIDIKENDLCPRYTARVINNVKVGASPQWIQEYLKISGLRPINNIVDISNYVMLETGQPLHAFDANKLKSTSDIKKIIVRRAKKGEKINTLDNEKYDLDENILVIADGKSPVCIAGIKGGKGPEIDEQTKLIILEAANFSPQIIRQASKQLKLQTDASWRFEQGIDPNLTKQAIDRVACLIQEIAGGQILQDVVDVYSNKVKPKEIKLDIEYVKRLLGISISVKDVSDILKRLGFKLQATNSTFRVIVPTVRIDICIPEDLIEEIGRIYGFEKIPSKLPSAVLIPSKRNENLIYQNKVKEILANLGFSEAYNYSFVSNKEEIELLNPISQEQKYLRSNLSVNLLKNIKDNKKYFKEVRLFEIGNVFQKDKNKVIEKKRLGAVLFPSDFYCLKGIIETLLNKLRITDIWYDESSKKNIRAEVKVGNDLLGWLTDDIFELDFEKLVELATEERIYSLPSKYPAVVRDVALLVDRGTKIVEVLNLINTIGGPLVCDVDLFDMYEGENIPENKKSLAFHIIYQANDHTLTDKEVNIIQGKIINELEKKWEVRR